MDTDVISDFNKKEADREHRASLYAWTFVGTLGAAMLGACAVALVAGGRITRRIYRLRHALAKVASGDWTARVTPSGHDEVTELMTGFNDMAEQLAENRTRIEYLTQVSAWQGIARRLAHVDESRGADEGQRFVVGLEAGMRGHIDFPAVGIARDDAQLLPGLHVQLAFTRFDADAHDLGIGGGAEGHPGRDPGP